MFLDSLTFICFVTGQLLVQRLLVLYAVFSNELNRISIYLWN